MGCWLARFISIAVVALALGPIVYQPWYGLAGDWFRVALVVALVAAGAWRIGVGLFLFLALLPASVALTDLLGYPYSKYCFVEFAGWGLAIGASIRIAWLRRPRFRLGPADCFIAGFWLINTLSLIQVINNLPGADRGLLGPLLTLGLRDLGWRSQTNGLYPLHQWYLLTLCLVLVYLLRDALAEKTEKVWVMRGALACTIVSLALGSIYFAAFLPVMDYRFSGFLTDTNQFAGFIFVLLSGLAAVLLTEARRLRFWLLLAGMALALAFLPFTFSKFIPVGIGLLIIIFLLVFGSSAHRQAIAGKLRTQYAVGTLIAVLSLMTAGMVIARFLPAQPGETIEHYDRVEPFFENTARMLDAEVVAGTLERGRYIFWISSELMIRDYPLSGVGVGRYLQIKSVYTPAVGPPYMNLPVQNSHNTYLQVGAELGLPGLALFVAIPLLALATALRTSEVHRRDRRALTTAFFLLGALLVNFITNDNYLVTEMQIIFWLGIGAILGIASPSSRRWTAAAGVVAAVTVVLFAVGLLQEPPKPRHRRFTGRVGVSYYELSNTQMRFRWLDRAAAWEQPLGYGRRMLTILPGPMCQSGSRDVELSIGGAFRMRSELQQGEAIALDTIFLEGEGADGVITFGFLCGPSVAPLSLGINEDPRFMSAQWVEPYNSWTLNRYRESIPEIRNEFYFPESMQGRSTFIWFRRSVRFLIDGVLEGFEPRLLINHPDAQDRPVTLMIEANGKLLWEIQIDRRDWITVPITSADLPPDSVITLSVNRTFVPAQLGEGDDERELGLAIDLSSLPLDDLGQRGF